MCAIADDKLQRVKVMFLLTLLLQINCLQFYIKKYSFLVESNEISLPNVYNHHNNFTACKSLLYFYSTIVIIDLQNFCKFTVLLATKIASKSL